MIDRNALAEAGWVLPEALSPLDDEQYEAWRPALTIYNLLTGGMIAASPLDNVDKRKVDLLREVLRAAPVEPRS